MSDLVQGGTALSRVEHEGDQRCDDGAAVPDHPKEFLCGMVSQVEEGVPYAEIRRHRIRRNFC